MARVRSPNFPVISLPQAVERIEVIYDHEQTVPADRETLAKHLGYSGLNGASSKIISALSKYGLLEEMPDKSFRVSKLAMAIMHPSSNEEKTDALREAASGPILFQRLNEQFGGQRPSETNLRSWLLRNGFARSGVDSVIKAYNETMDLVGASHTAYKEPHQRGGALQPFTGGSASAPEERQERPRMTTAFMEPTEPFSVEMLKGRVRVVGELSNKEDAQTLLDFLKSAISFLPTKSTAVALRGDDHTQAPDDDDFDL